MHEANRYAGADLPLLPDRIHQGRDRRSDQVFAHQGRCWFGNHNCDRGRHRKIVRDIIMLKFLKSIFGRKQIADVGEDSAPSLTVHPIVNSPAPETWQERVAAIQLPPHERISVSVKSSNGKMLLAPNEIELVGRAVTLSGLSKGRPEDIEFYLAAMRSGKLNGREIRKIGRQLSKDEKAGLGIKFRGIVTANFIDTLNDKGLADPENAAWVIASHASHLVSSAADLHDKACGGIERVKFRYGHMAAGHCGYSRDMDGRTIPINEAEPLPAERCKHPDQCGCRWQAWTPLLDEIQ